MENQPLSPAQLRRRYLDRILTPDSPQRIKLLSPTSADSDSPGLREIYPTSRERVAQRLLGDNPSSLRRDLVRVFMGTTGIGSQGPGIVDLTPVGAAFSAEEAEQRGDLQGAALSVIPGGGPMARRAITPLKGLFSAAEDAVRKSTSQKASWQDWSNFMRNHGVKEEELNWLGLGNAPKVKQPAWLSSQANPVDQVIISKNDLADWIARNKVSVGEIVKLPGDPSVLERAHQDREAVKRFQKSMRGQYGDDWPRQMTWREARTYDGLDRNRIISTHAANQQAEYPDIVMDDVGKNYQERLFVLEHPELRSFHGHNWREPRVLLLGHVRHEDREIGGKKTLHLDEIQSDLHQARRRMLKMGIDDVPEELRQADLPEAPFEKVWGDLLLKRMIRHAAENDYQQLSLTPGEIHVRRYKHKEHAEGNRVWYDTILVNKLNEIGKPYGAKVQWREFPEYEENARIAAFPITPALRKAALEKEFSLFNLSPIALGTMTPLLSDSPELTESQSWQ